MPLPTGEYNVRSFNATGNGSLQTTQLQNAMNATRDFGGTLYIPAGEYLVDNTVFDTFNSSGQFKDSNVIIRGDGPATRIILDSGGATNPIFNIRGASHDTRANWFTLKDLMLDGNGQPATWLSIVNNTSYCAITGNSFATSTGGIGNGDPSVPRGGNVTQVGTSTGNVISLNLGGSGA